MTYLLSCPPQSELGGFFVEIPLLALAHCQLASLFPNTDGSLSLPTIFISLYVTISIRIYEERRINSMSLSDYNKNANLKFPL
jgi:hypothetical protein